MPCTTRKRSSYRSFRVYSLFGGKKDKDENGEEAPSKVTSSAALAVYLIKFSVLL